MSFRYGFLNSKNGDRKYFASDFSMIFNGLIEDGVFGNVPDGFPVTSTGGMNIAVGKGLAWFSGTWNYIDAPYPLTVASADVLYARIDAVVIEVHNDNTVRTNYVKMVKGTPAAEPVPPSMEVEGYTLHPLAYVTVPAGAESISSENIRSVVGTSECPFVVGIQKTASVDQLFVQWQAEFEKWFQDLKDNLDENVAANLQNQNTTHVTDKTMHIPTLGYSKEGTVHQLTGLVGVSGLVSCIFTATDDFAEGDTVTVDGEEYAIQMPDGEAAPDKLFTSGVSVSVVVDKAGKKVNFKSAGGVKLPAGTWVIVKAYCNTADQNSISSEYPEPISISDTFVVPVSGEYKVTVVGCGGQGGSAESSREYGGGGGSSGGWAVSVLRLSKGQSIPITVNTSITSFGAYLSATAGSEPRYPSVISAPPGVATGGNLYNYSGIAGGEIGSGSPNKNYGVDGSKVSHPEKSPFLSETFGIHGYSSSTVSIRKGKPPAFNGMFVSLGAGGGGGGLYLSNEGAGGRPGFGAVIIELLLKGVNDT